MSRSTGCKADTSAWSNFVRREKNLPNTDMNLQVKKISEEDFAHFESRSEFYENREFIQSYQTYGLKVVPANDCQTKLLDLMKNIRTSEGFDELRERYDAGLIP